MKATQTINLATVPRKLVAHVRITGRRRARARMVLAAWFIWVSSRIAGTRIKIDTEYVWED